MIVYDLSCAAGHRFEGCFGSSGEFVRQQAQGLVTCPHCGSPQIAKAPMAPAIARKGNRAAVGESEAKPAPVVGGVPPPEVAQALLRLAEMQAEALKGSKWVGEKFAEQSRAIHYGEREAETIHGKATPNEAKQLLEEGIKVTPLPFPVAPPDELN